VVDVATTCEVKIASRRSRSREVVVTVTGVRSTKFWRKKKKMIRSDQIRARRMEATGRKGRERDNESENQRRGAVVGGMENDWYE